MSRRQGRHYLIDLLQKLGALGSELRGRKVAISLSASSFFTPAVRPEFYAGNFSLPAASGILFSNAIDFDLKAAIAKRMLQFPDTLAEDGMVELAAKCLASGRPVDRMVLMAIWPLGRLQTVMLDLQDHFEALLYIFAGGRPVPEWLRPVHSHRLRARKSSDADYQPTKGTLFGPRGMRRFGRASLPQASGLTWNFCSARLRSSKLNH